MDSLRHLLRRLWTHEHRWLIIILFLYAVWGMSFIWRNSGLIDGQRYFTLFDEATRSLRYAENLATNKGMFWNAGETFSSGPPNPLFTVLLALPFWLGVSKPLVGLAVSLGGLVTAVVSLYLLYRLAGQIIKGRTAALSVVLLTALYLPFSFWSWRGAETALLLALLLAAILMFMRQEATGRFSYSSYCLLAVAVLVRLEFIVLAATTGFFLADHDQKFRRQHFWGLGLLAATLFIFLFWHWRYYGTLLPAAFYQQFTGYSWLLRGWRGLALWWQFALGSLLLPLIVPIVIWLTRPTGPAARPLRLAATLIVAASALSIFAGGDAWELGGANRYLAPVIPLLFLALIWWLAQQRWAATRLPLIAFLLAAALVLLAYPAKKGWNYALLRRPAPEVSNDLKHVAIGRWLARITSADATVAAISAGPIFWSERVGVDLLGYSDQRVARRPARLIWSRAANNYVFRAGHVKWDYAYSIGELRPDVVLQLLAEKEVAEQILFENDYLYYPRDDYPDVFLRRGTGKISF